MTLPTLLRIALRVFLLMSFTITPPVVRVHGTLCPPAQRRAGWMPQGRQLRPMRHVGDCFIVNCHVEAGDGARRLRLLSHELSIASVRVRTRRVEDVNRSAMRTDV